ncbi:right-handed parallel beta-helix repeat-containing protein [bacterium]|nr:right-handed parallel beta-helix repeat-containing protein [bacterium]
MIEKLLPAFLFIALLSSPVTAKTLTVCQSGCDFITIQKAIDHTATQTGDIISPLDTIHTEPGIVVSKSVILVGDSQRKSIIQADETAEAAANRVFLIARGAMVIFKNLVIRHGNPPEYPNSGGGINNQGHLTIDNCEITQNIARTSGGGIWNNGVLLIENSDISFNRALRRGQPGYACGSGGGIQNEKGSSLVIKNSIVSNNHSEKAGGGLFISCESAAAIINTKIHHNKSVVSGGGVRAMGNLSISNSQISENSVGGITASNRLDMSNTTVSGNTHGANCHLACNRGVCGKAGELSGNKIEGGECVR